MFCFCRVRFITTHKFQIFLYSCKILFHIVKKLYVILIVVLIIGIPFAWYTISPIFRVLEKDESSPLDNGKLVIKDSMDTMDTATKAEFEKQVEAMKDKVMVMNDAMSSAKILAQGEFKPRAHNVQGKALLIEKDEKKFVRFEDFETINGPDLHIYLSTGLNNDDFVELSKIKATKGNVNYEVPEGVDTGKYNKVLVWCKAFGVLFSYAALS